MHSGPTQRRILITGPTGCVGSALVRQLQQEAAGELFGFCRTPGESAISLRSVDVANEDEVRSAVHEIQPTQIIHLAAAQTPYCNEHPLAGMRINAGGTAHLLQAAADLRSLERVVFASSAAVYGHRALYPWPTVHPDQELRPVNHYGRWKLAGEGMVRAFHEQTGVPCCMLRFATTFGPGRDLGLTSAGTSAMKAIALGRPFRLPYHGPECYHYVDDVAAAFRISALAPFSGCEPFNIRGHTMDATAFLERMKQAADELGLPAEDIAFAEDADRNTFVYDLDAESFLQCFPDLPLTDTYAAILETLTVFKAQASAGVLI